MSVTPHSFPIRKFSHPVICGQNAKSKTEIKSKTVLQFRSIHQSDLPAVKINPELPFKGLLPHFPLIVKNLTLAIRLPSELLKKDLSYGKIIQAPFST
jgi:hypothetical protein